MSFWDTYDWNKAAQGPFVPPHIPGNAQSDASIAHWNALRPDITPDVLEASRGPATSLTGAAATVDPGLLQLYQARERNLPQPAVGSPTLNKGPVDPLALQAKAQHLPYDLDARRNAIAAQLMNQPGGGLRPEQRQQRRPHGSNHCSH